MKKLFNLILIITSVFTSKIYAGALIEPFVGTHLSSEIADEDDSYAVTGLFYGLKVGYQASKVGVGLDYRTGTFSVEDTDDDLVSNTADLYLSFIASDAVRFWLQYNVYKDIYINQSPKYEYLADPQILLGLGFKVANHASLNLEYTKTNVSETKLGSTEYDTDFYYQYITLSLSFPFML